MINCIKLFDQSALPFAVSTLGFNTESLVKERGKFNSLGKESDDRVRNNIITKIVINIMKIVSSGVQTVCASWKLIAEFSKNLSCLVYLRCFSVFAIVINGVASFIDLFRVIEKLHHLEVRINTELDHAVSQSNGMKEKEVMAYKLVKHMDIMTSVYSVALSIVTIFEFFGAFVFSPAATLGIVGFGGLLYLASFIVSKIYDIDGIEKRYFGKAKEEI